MTFYVVSPLFFHLVRFDQPITLLGYADRRAVNTMKVSWSYDVLLRHSSATLIKSLLLALEL